MSNGKQGRGNFDPVCIVSLVIKLVITDTADEAVDLGCKGLLRNRRLIGTRELVIDGRDFAFGLVRRRSYSHPIAVYVFKIFRFPAAQVLCIGIADRKNCIQIAIPKNHLLRC